MPLKLNSRFGAGRQYFPCLMTGFEYGKLGTSLYGSANGFGNIGYFAIVDLGHELFIWFVFLAMLIKKRDGIQEIRRLLGSFFKSPVIIAILPGIGINLLGIQEQLYEYPITGGVILTLGYLGNLTVPLILLIAGYGIQLDRHRVKEASTVIGLRLTVLRIQLLIPTNLASPSIPAFYGQVGLPDLTPALTAGHGSHSFRLKDRRSCEAKFTNKSKKKLKHRIKFHSALERQPTACPLFNLKINPKVKLVL